MIKKQRDTAILIFANTSAEEVKRKKITNGCNLFEYLNQKTLLETKKTGLDVIFHSEEHQKGNSFGERFSNAIADVFSKGYKHVITLGNDTPDLKLQHLAIAKEHLKNETLTIGPSLDGGTYLITLSKKEFNKEEFAQLPWQTSKLFVSLQEYLQINGKKTKQLKRLKDVDSVADLQSLLTRYKQIAPFLKELILNLIYSIKKAFSLLVSPYSEIQLSAYYNKGSPCIL